MPSSAQAPLPHFRDGAGRAEEKNIQISGTLQNLVPNKPAAQFSTQDKTNFDFCRSRDSVKSAVRIVSADSCNEPPSDDVSFDIYIYVATCAAVFRIYILYLA